MTCSAAGTSYRPCISSDRPAFVDERRASGPPSDLLAFNSISAAEFLQLLAGATSSKYSANPRRSRAAPQGRRRQLARQAARTSLGSTFANCTREIGYPARASSARGRCSHSRIHQHMPPSRRACVRADERGRARPSCPDHQWAYDLDARLFAARHMGTGLDRTKLMSMRSAPNRGRLHIDLPRCK
jgi:hypothetical protein